MPDEDGYPTEDELRRIREWPWGDYQHLFNFIEGLLAYHDFCWELTDAAEDLMDRPVKRLYLSTASWSAATACVSTARRPRPATASTIGRPSVFSYVPVNAS